MKIHTPETDKVVADLLRKQAASEKSGKTIDCIFESLVEFTKELESRMNGTSLLSEIKLGSKVLHPSKPESALTITEIDLNARTITAEQFGENRKWNLSRFAELLDFETKCQGAVIEN